MNGSVREVVLRSEDQRPASTDAAKELVATVHSNPTTFRLNTAMARYLSGGFSDPIKLKQTLNKCLASGLLQKAVANVLLGHPMSYDAETLRAITTGVDSLGKSSIKKIK